MTPRTTLSLGAQRRTAPPQKGFSLLELLVAFSIMALSLGMLYRVSGNNMRLIATSARQDQASVLAESLLSMSNAVAEAGWNQQGDSAGFQWTVRSAPYGGGSTDPLAPRLHQVWTTIVWQENGQAKRLELTTLLPQRKP